MPKQDNFKRNIIRILITNLLAVFIIPLIFMVFSYVDFNIGILTTSQAFSEIYLEHFQIAITALIAFDILYSITKISLGDFDKNFGKKIFFSLLIKVLLFAASIGLIVYS